MKKALVVNPYWDTLGGGENYTANVMYALERAGYQVTTFYCQDGRLNADLKNRFDIPVNVKIDKLGHDKVYSGNILKKWSYEKDFELIFWVSDGSIPMLFGKKNIIHFQVPFTNKTSCLNNVINFAKWKQIQAVVCNSNFTKNVIDTTFRINSRVLYPPCNMFEPDHKEQVILSVGRFDGLLHSKRQDVLIEAFRQLGINGWKMVLAGGCKELNKANDFKQLSSDINVEFLVNPDFNELKKVYGKATLYWHAAGYKVNEIDHPEEVEHFGMSTVEAMSAGAIPFSYNAGGQREVITDGKNGFLWTTIDELVTKTMAVIKDKQRLLLLSEAARLRATEYSKDNFRIKIANYF